MSGLSFDGPLPSQPNDVADQAYVNALTASNLTQNQIDALIAAGYAPYATKAYVSQQDALNANQAYIDAGDATRVHLDQVNANSGAAGLDSTGKIQVSRVAMPSSQRYLEGSWSPSAYNSSNVTATATEVLIYTCPVSDPGYIYRLVVTGQVDTKITVDGQYPIVNVRVGSVTGQIIARGYGNAESYTDSGNANAGTVSIIPSPMGIQNSLAGSTTLYVTTHSSGAGSTVTASTARPSLCVMAIPDSADNETAALQNAVVYDAVGAGANGHGRSLSWVHVIGDYANAVIAMVSLHDTPTPPITVTATLGGVPMTSLGSAYGSFGSGGKGGDTNDDLFAFILFNPPTGAQTIAVNFPLSYVVGNSVSYDNVTRFGAPTGGGNGGSPLLPVPSGAGQLVVQGFLCADAVGSFSAYSQTTRYNAPGVVNVCEPLIVGDAPGAATVNFSATEPAGATYWIGVAAPLFGGVVPAAPVFDAVGAGYSGGGVSSFSWSHTVSAGACVLVDICVDQNFTVSSCTCDGVGMTLLSSFPNDNTASFGYLTRYYINNVAAGSNTIAVVLSGACHAVAAGSASYTGVGTVYPSQAAQAVYGTGSPASQMVNCSQGQIIVSALAAHDAATAFTASGGINRFNSYFKPSTTYNALLAITESTGAPVVSGDNRLKSATFMASATTLNHWSGIATVLSG